MKDKWILYALAIGISGFSTSTLAADPNTWYGGVGFGITNMDDDVLGTNVDDDDIGWKLFGGYQFLDNLAVEGAWASLGEHKALTAASKTTGFAIEAVGTVPIQDNFDIFGKLGGFFWSSEQTNTSAVPPTVDDDGVDLTAGLGVSWQLPKDMIQNVAIRGEWEFFGAEQDVTMYSLGVALQF